MLKKKLLAVCMMAVMACMTLTACGSDDSDSGKETSKTEAGDKAGKTDGYVFKYNGVEVVVDAEADAIIDKLGEPASYFEADSCAFQGKDKTYGYGSFEITTYEENGKDYISTILLKDDTVATVEGLTIGQSIDDMVNAYSDGYDANTGMYTYKKGNMKLIVIMEDDSIKSIEYSSLALE